MIEDLEDALQMRRVETVIHGGCRVQENERDAEGSTSGNVPGVSAKNRKHHEDYQSHDAQSESDAVSYAVGQFFDQALIFGSAHNCEAFYATKRNITEAEKRRKGGSGVIVC